MDQANTQPDLSRYVPTGTAARRLGCHADTLRSMARLGRIASTRTASNRWLFDVEGYLKSKGEQAAA
ncbi:MAG: MerR family DNA-binding transcriptional regulator [Hyphomicrobiaceae bacterium]